MERIKTETIKFTVEDIEKLVIKHLKEVEKLQGAIEIEWLLNSRSASAILEVVTNVAVATGPI